MTPVCASASFGRGGVLRRGAGVVTVVEAEGEGVGELVCGVVADGVGVEVLTEGGGLEVLGEGAGFNRNRLFGNLPVHDCSVLEGTSDCCVSGNIQFCVVLEQVVRIVL